MKMIMCDLSNSFSRYVLVDRPHICETRLYGHCTGIVRTFAKQALYAHCTGIHLRNTIVGAGDCTGIVPAIRNEAYRIVVQLMDWRDTDWENAYLDPPPARYEGPRRMGRTGIEPLVQQLAYLPQERHDLSIRRVEQLWRDTRGDLPAPGSVEEALLEHAIGSELAVSHEIDFGASSHAPIWELFGVKNSVPFAEKHPKTWKDTFVKAVLKGAENPASPTGRQIFRARDLKPIAERLVALDTEGNGVVLTVKLKTIANPTRGIQGGKKITLTMNLLVFLLKNYKNQLVTNFLLEIRPVGVVRFVPCCPLVHMFTHPYA